MAQEGGAQQGGSEPALDASPVYDLFNEALGTRSAGGGGDRGAGEQKYLIALNEMSITGDGSGDTRWYVFVSSLHCLLGPALARCDSEWHMNHIDDGAHQTKLD